MEVKAQSEKAAILSQVKKALFTRNQHNEQSHFNPEFPLGNLMEKKQFLWDFCSDRGGNSELFPTRRDEKHQKVFFYTNLVPKARLMENLGLTTCRINTNG